MQTLHRVGKTELIGALVKYLGINTSENLDLAFDPQGILVLTIDDGKPLVPVLPEVPPAPVTPPVQPVSPLPDSPSGLILQRALADVSKLSTKDDAGTDHGNLGCADAVTRILVDELGLKIAKTLSTNDLYSELKSAGWKDVDVRTPGAVIISPTCASMDGHTGIIGENGLVYSNSSATGLWTQNFTVDRWLEYYKPCGTYAFVPPDPAPAAPAGELEMPTDIAKYVKCVATCFGYKDPGDDGRGAFGDNNADPKTVGVSVPIPILRDSIGYVAKLIKKHKVRAAINGKTLDIPITDAGPGYSVDGQRGLIVEKATGIGHYLDLTYGACEAFGVRYDASSASYQAMYCIIDSSGQPIDIKGLDSPKRYV